MGIEGKISEIWWWLGMEPQYKKGVKNNDVINRFGDEYREAWARLKQRSRRSDGLIYCEKKRWFRWFRN